MNSHESPTSEGWLVTLLRSSFFIDPTETMDIEGFWLDLTDQQPDEIRELPKEARSIRSAIVDGVSVKLVKQINKIDLLFEPRPPEIMESFEIPNLGDLESNIPLLRRMISLAFEFEKRPDFERVALGVISLRRVATRTEAYQVLDGLLPEVVLDGERTSDFVYRINCPRMAEFNGSEVKLNRLSHWSAIMMNVTTNHSAPKSADANTAHYFCRVETDVNTDQNYAGDFGASDMEPLVSETMEMLANGTSHFRIAN